MKVHITVDRFDGRKSKAVTRDLGGFGMSELAFMMMNASVAGVTITKADCLDKAIKKLEERQDADDQADV